MTAAVGLDPANVTGIGLGGAVLYLAFRTFWKQEGGWRAVLAATQEDAAKARADAATARVDAAMARMDASAARGAEQECRRRLGELERQQRHTNRRLDELDSGETPTTS